MYVLTFYYKKFVISYIKIVVFSITMLVRKKYKNYVDIILSDYNKILIEDINVKTEFIDVFEDIVLFLNNESSFPFISNYIN